MCVHDALIEILEADNLDVFIEFINEHKQCKFNKCCCSSKPIESFSFSKSIVYGAIKIFKYLLKTNLIDMKKVIEETTLCDVIDNREFIELLLQNNADPDKKDYDKDTPLHLAVINNDKEIIELLLQYNADPDKKDYDKDTPLHIAVKNNNKEVVELLLQHNADPNRKDYDDNMPLRIAVKNNNKEIVELLLHHNANPNRQNDKGNTPLHIAAKNNNKEIIELLLQHNADPNIQNIYRNTPLQIAMKNSHKKIVTLLFPLTDTKKLSDYKFDIPKNILLILSSYYFDENSLFSQEYFHKDVIILILQKMINEKLSERCKKLIAQ